MVIVSVYSDYIRAENLMITRLCPNYEDMHINISLQIQDKNVTNKVPNF